MKIIRKILCTLLAATAVVLVLFLAFYSTRLMTVASIKKLTEYEKFNLYRIDVRYDYNLDKVIADCGTSDSNPDDAKIVGSMVKRAVPFLPVKMKAPKFACSAFAVETADGKKLMGRNYDFRGDASCMAVFTAPPKGYKAIAFADLNNIKANKVDGFVKKMTCLAAPFICLDGINEQGLSVAVLWVDSEPARQKTGKPVLSTTLAIRLMLDNAATTQEAVDLLRQYDMFAQAGGDYHFYVSDASGDGRVIEFDPHTDGRTLTVTPVRTVTNFYELYKDKVLPGQRNGIYGHGKERYLAIEEILTREQGNISESVAFSALQAAAQLPKPNDVTSNTQWSIVFNNTDRRARIVIKRDWSTITELGF